MLCLRIAFSGFVIMVVVSWVFIMDIVAEVCCFWVCYHGCCFLDIMVVVAVVVILVVLCWGCYGKLYYPSPYWECL